MKYTSVKYQLRMVRMYYSTEEKAKLLEGWKSSGKIISSYVKEKGLIRWAFTKWIKTNRESTDMLR